MGNANRFTMSGHAGIVENRGTIDVSGWSREQLERITQPQPGETFCVDGSERTLVVKDCFGGWAYGLEFNPGPYGFHVHAEDGTEWDVTRTVGGWLGRPMRT